MIYKSKKDSIEEKKGGFTCANCKKWVNFSDSAGTRHRNHCPYCLSSQHVDLKVSGDRKSDCLGNMLPIGLTLKEEGVDKYGNKRQGDIMVIHRCVSCDKISINRIAADDDDVSILELLLNKIDDETKFELEESKIIPLSKGDMEKVRSMLFGNIISS